MELEKMMFTTTRLIGILKSKPPDHVHGYGSDAAHHDQRPKISVLTKMNAPINDSYEVRWENLEDAKQNTWEDLEKLRLLGVEAYGLAYDDRMAAQAAGTDQRPLSTREIVKHFEQY